MPIIKPYEGTSKNRLTELINSANELKITENVDFTYGDIESISGSSGRNTRATLIPLNADLFAESSINYVRLPISVLEQLPAGELDTVNIPQLPFTIHSILPLINAALGLDLVTDEVQDTLYTQAQTEYALTIKNGSYSWLPSVYNFKAITSGMILTELGDPLLTEQGFAFELESA